MRVRVLACGTSFLIAASASFNLRRGLNQVCLNNYGGSHRSSLYPVITTSNNNCVSISAEPIHPNRRNVFRGGVKVESRVGHFCGCLWGGRVVPRRVAPFLFQTSLVLL
ncbi:unnamed protein product, partial [Mycena citricolor]